MKFFRIKTALLALAVLGICISYGMLRTTIEEPSSKSQPYYRLLEEDDQKIPDLSGPSRARENDVARRAGRLLIESIILVESRGNPKCVGPKGERGLMQIRQGTWEETTRNMYGAPLPFEQAFDGPTNRAVGAHYLEALQRQLLERKERWQSSLNPLLLASYNGGIQLVDQCDYNPERFPTPVKRYVQRVSNLYEDAWRQERENKAVQVSVRRIPPTPSPTTIADTPTAVELRN